MPSAELKAKINQTQKEDFFIQFIAIYNIKLLLEADTDENTSSSENALIDQLEKIRKSLQYGILYTNKHEKLVEALNEITEVIEAEKNSQNKESIYQKVTAALTWIYHQLLSFFTFCCQMQNQTESVAELRPDVTPKVSQTSCGFFSSKEKVDETKLESKSQNVLVYS